MAVTIVTETDRDGNIIDSYKKERRRYTKQGGSEVVHLTAPQPKLYWRGEKGGRAFNFIKDGVLQYQVNYLTLKELGYLVYLSTFCNYDGVLRLSERGKAVTNVEDFQKILGLTKKKYAETLVIQLLESEIIMRVELEIKGMKCGGFKISRDAVTRGYLSRKDRGTSTKSYFKGIKAIYNENGAASVGFLAILLPFLDRHTNILIKNPSREFGTEMQLMSIKNIADNVGMSKQAVSKKIKETTILGFPVFEKIIAGSECMKVKLNPLVANKMPPDVEDSHIQEFSRGTDSKELLSLLGVN